MACDYVLHVAHAFRHSEAPTNRLRVRQALTMVGNAILGAAITTAASCVFLLVCTITFFTKMGVVIVINTTCSIFFALVFFPSILCLGGGGGRSGAGGAEPMKMESIGEEVRNSLNEDIGEGDVELQDVWASDEGINLS